MFYLEFLLFFLIIILFFLHTQIEDLYSFFLYNSSPFVFGFLSLNSIYEITNEHNLIEILFFIINDERGMGIFVALYFCIFVFCFILLCYNFYVIYEEKCTQK